MNLLAACLGPYLVTGFWGIFFWGGGGGFFFLIIIIWVFFTTQLPSLPVGI